MKQTLSSLLLVVFVSCSSSKVQVEKIGMSNPLYELRLPLHPNLGIFLEVLKDQEGEDFFLISEKGAFSSGKVELGTKETLISLPSSLLQGGQKIHLDGKKFHEWIESSPPSEALLKIGNDLHLFVEIQPWIEQYKKLERKYARYQ